MIVGKYREQIFYLFFGVITTAVNWSVFIFLVYLDIALAISNVVSWITAVTVAFFTNRWWVFKSSTKGFRNISNEGIAFVGSRILTGILEWVLVPIFVQIGLDRFIFNVAGLDAKILVTIVVIIGNYVISKVWVFKANDTKCVDSYGIIEQKPCRR